MIYENITLTKAHLGRRFLAYLIDGFILTGLTLPALIVFVIATRSSHGYRNGLVVLFLFLLAVLLYLLPLAYCLLKDGVGQGQSLGKRISKIQVVSISDMKACTYGKSAGRNGIMLLLNLIPLVGWLIEPIIVLSEQHARRLGDKLADTMVVDCKECSEITLAPIRANSYQRILILVIAVIILQGLYFDMIAPLLGLDYFVLLILRQFFYFLNICIPFACAFSVRDKALKIVLIVFSTGAFLVWLLGPILQFL